MAETILLKDIPDSISSSYLPYTPTLRQKQRAISFYKASYIKRVNFYKENDKIIINAKVYRSQKKSEDPHSVNIDIDSILQNITDAHCSCKAGIAGQCAHVLAVIISLEEWKISGFKDVPSEMASTSLPQQWDKPRGSKIRPEPVSQLVISRPLNTNRKRKPVMANFIDNRNISLKKKDIEHLQSLTESPISYLLESYSYDNMESSQNSTGSALDYHTPLIQPIGKPRGVDANICGDIFFPKLMSSLVNLKDLDDKKYEWQHLELTQEEAVKLERSTQGQSQDSKWFVERKKRITASNFGKVIKRKKEINNTFMKNTFENNFKSSAPTTYGKNSEKIAKQMYINKTGNHLHDVGLVVNPALPILGSTPDALVCEKKITGIVEIKCPWSARDMNISEACTTIKDFFLQTIEDSHTLKKDHIHWYQVQGQLLTTGAPFCDFVTYTREELIVQRIFPDQPTMQMIVNKLSEFYVHHFKPYFNT